MKRTLALMLALLMFAVPILAQSAEITEPVTEETNPEIVGEIDEVDPEETEPGEAEPTEPDETEPEDPEAAEPEEPVITDPVEPEDEAEEEPEPEDEDERPLIEDPEYRAQVASDALPLLEIVASVAGQDLTVDGAPDADVAWAAMSVYGNDLCEDGQVLSANEMEGLYIDLFALGAFADIAHEPSGQFTAVDGGYQFAASAGELPYEVAISRADEYEGSNIVVELTTYQVSHGGEWQVLVGNVRAEITPSPLTAFGAQLVSWTPMELPVFDAAEATGTLNPQEGNTYDAANVIDGKNETCWAYAESDGAVTLTLSASAPQTVRGISLTPGYAKTAYAFSSNRRVAELTIKLDDGCVIEAALDDLDKQDFEQTVVIPFDSAHEVSSLTIEVTATYDGTHFADTCISEIVMF